MKTKETFTEFRIKKQTIDLDRVIRLIEFTRNSLESEIEEKKKEIYDNLLENVFKPIRDKGWVICANQMLEKLDTLIELIQTDVSVKEVEE